MAAIDDPPLVGGYSILMLHCEEGNLNQVQKLINETR
jgi:hypothetical protein